LASNTSGQGGSSRSAPRWSFFFYVTVKQTTRRVGLKPFALAKCEPETAVGAKALEKTPTRIGKTRRSGAKAADLNETGSATKSPSAEMPDRQQSSNKHTAVRLQRANETTVGKIPLSDRANWLDALVARCRCWRQRGKANTGGATRLHRGERRRITTAQGIYYWH